MSTATTLHSALKSGKKYNLGKSHFLNKIFEHSDRSQRSLRIEEEISKNF